MTPAWTPAARKPWAAQTPPSMKFSISVPRTFLEFQAHGTGVIGQRINVEAIEKAVPALCAALERSAEASDAAGHAIMTTDTVKKEAAVETTVGGKTVHWWRYPRLR